MQTCLIKRCQVEPNIGVLNYPCAYIVHCREWQSSVCHYRGDHESNCYTEPCTFQLWDNNRQRSKSVSSGHPCGGRACLLTWPSGGWFVLEVLVTILLGLPLSAHLSLSLGLPPAFLKASTIPISLTNLRWAKILITTQPLIFFRTIGKRG